MNKPILDSIVDFYDNLRKMTFSASSVHSITLSVEVFEKAYVEACNINIIPDFGVKQATNFKYYGIAIIKGNW